MKLCARIFLFLVFALAALAPTHAREMMDGLEVMKVAALPREGRDVHALIKKGGPFEFDRDGIVFSNREGILPKKKRGFYREYTVKTPGARNRGARRIVCGAENADWSRNAPTACYYTDDHYASFRRIIE
jgi:ribonuclease T1